MRIGFLTSGGDAPGMNAALLGAVQACNDLGHELVAVEDGYSGLVAGRVADFERMDLEAAASLAGTILRTSRWPDMRTSEGADRATAAVKDLAVDGLIVAGGAGSTAGARELSARGVPAVVVPSTIDRDMSYDTDTLGTDSALNYALNAIDSLRATASALPGRAFLIETLGGDTGHLAGMVAELVGSSVVLTPEQPWEPNEVGARMRNEVRKGYVFVIMSEGVGTAPEIATTLESHYGERIRHTSLGHSMRGASPSAVDRALGRAAGRASVSALAGDRGGAALVLAGRAVVGQVPLDSL